MSKKPQSFGILDPGFLSEVVMFFPNNDLPDMLRDTYRGYAKPYFGDSLEPPPHPPPTFRSASSPAWSGCGLASHGPSPHSLYGARAIAIDGRRIRCDEARIGTNRRSSSTERLPMSAGGGADAPERASEAIDGRSSDVYIRCIEAHARATAIDDGRIATKTVANATKTVAGGAATLAGAIYDRCKRHENRCKCGESRCKRHESRC